MKYVLALVMLVTTGCVTTIEPAGDSENVWIVEKHRLSHDTVLFCTPNKTAEGIKPICYEADRMNEPKQKGTLPFGSNFAN